MNNFGTHIKIDKSNTSYLKFDKVLDRFPKPIITETLGGTVGGASGSISMSWNPPRSSDLTFIKYEIFISSVCTNLIDNPELFRIDPAEGFPELDLNDTNFLFTEDASGNGLGTEQEYCIGIRAVYDEGVSDISVKTETTGNDFQSVSLLTSSSQSFISYGGSAILASSDLDPSHPNYVPSGTIILFPFTRINGFSYNIRWINFFSGNPNPLSIRITHGNNEIYYEENSYPECTVFEKSEGWGLASESYTITDNNPLTISWFRSSGFLSLGPCGNEPPDDDSLTKIIIRATGLIVEQ